MENPQYRKAYYIGDGSDKIQTGQAFNITYLDYGYNTTRTFFIKDGIQFPEMVYPKNIAYDKTSANELLIKTKADRKKYYEKQLAEAQEKLNQLL